jgi:hypothetical protein
MNAGMQQGMVAGIEIISMIVTPAGTYQDQVRRPYNTRADGEIIRTIQERFDQSGGRTQAISSGLFDGVASNFVAPQIAPEGPPIAIAGGWRAERFNFIMKVKIFNRIGGFSIDVINGHSDYMDASYSGALDPRIRFFINGIVRVVSQKQHTEHGIQMTGKVVDSYQVLANHQYNGPQDFYLNQNDPNMTMRPDDVFSALQAQEYSTNSDLLDMRSVATGQAKTSSRNNTLSSSYAGSVVRGYVDAVTKSMFAEDNRQVYADAIGATAQKPLSRDEFIRAIGNLTGSPMADSFQLMDLYRLDPQLQSPQDDRIRIVRPQPVVRMGNWAGNGPSVEETPMAGNSNHWMGQNHETLAATILSNGLPALLLEYGIVELVFQATNHSRVPVIETIFARGLADNYDCRPSVPALENRIQRELIDQISFNNDLPYNLRVHCDVAWSTKITIQFTNEVMEFVSPTFADSLLTPIITSDRERLSDVAHSFGSLVHSLVQVKGPSLESVRDFSNF